MIEDMSLRDIPVVTDRGEYLADITIEQMSLPFNNYRYAVLVRIGKAWNSKSFEKEELERNQEQLVSDFVKESVDKYEKALDTKEKIKKFDFRIGRKK
jgi:hypothetical protein